MKIAQVILYCERCGLRYVADVLASRLRGDEMIIKVVRQQCTCVRR